MNIQDILEGKSKPLGRSIAGKTDLETDITTMSVQDIFRSGLFTAEERKKEYRRRGKSPSGVIDGVYNDTYRENGRPYHDCDRDWEADA